MVLRFMLDSVPLEPQLNRKFRSLGVTRLFRVVVALKKTSRRLSKSQFFRRM
jgi:hypothetical protein